MISARYQNNNIEALDLNPVQLEMKRQIEGKIDLGQYQFEEVPCAICLGRDFFQLAEKDRYGLYCSNVACRSCGLVMINPRMTEASYNEFYNQEYRTLYAGIHSNAANFFKAQNTRGRRLYQYLRSKDLIGMKRNTPFLLEVGCGAGGILDYFKKSGFEVMGIDLGAEYLEYGKKQGLDLRLGTLGDIDIPRTPDIIIYSHVLEHVLDLNRELIQLKAISGAQTTIYIEVPGIKNIAMGYRNDPLRYFQNAHSYSFSLTSLRNLCTKHNFEILHGNEFVRAVFKPGKQKASSHESDYQDIIEFLTKAEELRKYYFISWARLKVIADAFWTKFKVRS